MSLREGEPRRKIASGEVMGTGDDPSRNNTLPSGREPRQTVDGTTEWTANPEGAQAQKRLRTPSSGELVARKPAPGCPACEQKRLHTDEEKQFHPYMGHGYTKEMGWTHPDLEPER